MIKEKILKKLEGLDIKKIAINENGVKLQVQLLPGEDAAKQEIIIKNLLSDFDVQITFFIKDESKKPFKKIIGISSGKGGVGKSTISLHIAFALKEMGFKVGILDADIYAPSIPVFLNVNENPISVDGRTIEPIKTEHGFQLLSMGLFLKENQAAMWRGPMLASAFNQFLEQGNWDCEYLIIDLPPGTTDIHMSCSKIAAHAEFVLVGMPNKLVYTDVYRMYAVLRSLNLKVVGLIENMAYSVCKNCKFEERWSSNTVIKEVEKIAQLPIFNHFHQLNEDGYPGNYVQTYEAEFFNAIARKLVA